MFIAVSALPALALDLNLTTTADGLRVLTTKEAPEDFGRGLPMGPSSVQFAGQSLWAVDSLNGRFVEYDLTGKELRAIKVDKADKLIIADFAFEKDAEGKNVAIWAVGSEEAQVLKIDLEGKILTSFSTGLSFPARLELLPGGCVAVLDQAAPKIATFDASGRKLREQPCLGKGFVAEANGDILFLNRKDDKVALCRWFYNISVPVTEVKVLDVGCDAEPSLLMFRNNDEVFFSFHSLDEKTGAYAYNITRTSLAGNFAGSRSFAFPAAFINRPLLDDGKSLFLVEFNDESGAYLLKINEFEMIEEASQG